MMNIKVRLRSLAAVALVGLGLFAGVVAAPGSASARTHTTRSASSAARPAAHTTTNNTRTVTHAARSGTPRTHASATATQAALAAKATVTKQQAEQTALTASPGNTIHHSRLADDNGTVYWDVDFTNGGGVKVNAQTGAVIATEAAGTDHGARPGTHAARHTTTP